MGNEQNEILNAIRSGFFNEGIYRIKEESAAVVNEEKIPLAEHKKDAEIIVAADHSVSVAEEPINKLAAVTNIEIPVKLHETEIAIDYFGGNKNGVAILVNYPDEEFIYFKDKIILERILASVKLTFDDVALINTHLIKINTLEEMAEKFHISKVIGFGVNDPFLKGINREEPVKMPKTSLFLMNSNLSDIAMDNTKKRILWNNLKLMFNIA
jgi:DNA polymerase III psi subunit